jgi:hypothetical protein
VRARTELNINWVRMEWAVLSVEVNFYTWHIIRFSGTHEGLSCWTLFMLNTPGVVTG